jgi:hypothetical protein
MIVSLSIITMVLGSMVVPPARGVAAAIPPNGMTAADLNSLFNTYGNAGGHWTGADGTTSVALPDGRVVWLFADTFLGTINADFSRPNFSPLVNNSIVVQQGTELTETLHGGTTSEPKALVSPTQDGEFFWVVDGIVENGELKIIYNRYRRSGTGTLDFILTGTSLATFVLPNLILESVADLPLGSEINWGSALLPDGSYTYVYGTSSAPGRMKFAHLARAAAGDLGGPWQFWTGSTWSSDPEEATRLISGVGTGFSMQKIDGQYVLVTHENNLLFDPQIVAYTAQSPTGPFSGPVHLYTAPEVQPGSKIIAYDARLHPELARAGKLLISYNVNSLEFADQMADARLYRPRFVEVNWPLSTSPGTPAAPTDIAASAQDDTAQVSWAAVSGATSYRIYQRDVTGGQTHFARQPSVITATTRSIGLLIPGHQYEFMVAGVNSTGEGALSPVVRATPHSSRPVAEMIRYSGTEPAIDGSYLVSLREGVFLPENLNDYARQLLDQQGGIVKRLFPLTLNGFSAEMTEAQARDLASHPDVVDVEQNTVVSLDETDASRPTNGSRPTDGSQVGNVPWHLDRIDQRDEREPDGVYRYPNDGAGVKAWVVDTGIWPGHPEFEGRVGAGYNGIDLSTDTADCHGHGTKVSGTLGGTDNGVAKGVTIIPVKVFNCSGNTRNDSLITGIEWVTQHAKAPAIMNLSVGDLIQNSSASRLNWAVNRTLRSGLTVVTSAGQRQPAGGSACGAAPNNERGVIVVGATSQGLPPGYQDHRWRFSNFGSCVDIWAPGERIRTAGLNDGTSESDQGTSLSAGMVSGAAAIVLAAHPDYDNSAVERALVDASTPGVQDHKSEKDGLLYIEQPPVIAPTNLTATSNNDGTIGLSWDPVPEPNVHYVVSYRDVTAAEAEFAPLGEPVFGVTRTTTQELILGHRYEFVVAAANTAGTGPNSNIASAVSSVPPPSAPTGLAAVANADGTIALSWSSLGPDIWYWIYQRDVTAGETEFTKLELPVTSGASMTAGYLLHGHEYEFVVSGINRGGEGTKSSPVSATSSHPRPEAPTRLSASAGDGQVELDWSGSSTPGTWYSIYMRDVTGGEASFTKLELPVTGCCAMTAGYLSNGKEYEFKVTAIAQGGESADSNLVRAVPRAALPGQVTQLTATARGDGTIGLAWTAPGENLFFDVYLRDVSAGEAVFTKLEYPVTTCCTFTAGLLAHAHQYEFKVSAVNETGSGPLSPVARATASYSLPTAPRNLRGVTAGDGSIDLTWDAPSSGGFYYWVYRRDITAGEVTFAKGTFPTTNTSASLGLLVHGHVYEFKVAAENQGGEGPASTAARVTASGGLPAPPSGLTATAGDGQVFLSWISSSTSNVLYNVYRRNATVGESWTKLDLPVQGTSMTVGFLANGQNYQFKVTASNFAGDSAASGIASAKPMPPLPQPPTGLSAAAGDGKVTLRWTATPTSSVYYWIEYRAAGGSWTRMSYPVDSCCVKDVTYLRNGITFDFRLRSTNLTGDSAPSNVASARPMPPFPQPPTGLTATAGNSKVTLRWAASPTPNVYYWLEHRARGGAWQRMKYPIGTCCTHESTFLNNGTTYDFRLRATNLAGDSSVSNTASARPMPPIPQAPTNLKAAGGGSEAYLSWSASSTPYVGYTVYLRNVTRGQGWSAAIELPVGTAAHLKYLRRGDLYEFRVRAHNMSGQSPPSNTARLWMSYVEARLACDNIYTSIRGILQGETAVHSSAFGVAPQEDVRVTVRFKLHINYRLHQEWTGVRFYALPYWESYYRRSVQADPLGASARVDLSAQLLGPSGQNWGYAAAPRPCYAKRG